MGTWGWKPFENDAAMDWVAQLVDCDDATPLADSLRALLECDPRDRETDLCCEAIASAKILQQQYHQRINKNVIVTSYDKDGNPVSERSVVLESPLPEEADAFLARLPHSPTNLMAAAVYAIEAIRDQSQLRELWADSEEGLDPWTESLNDMLEFLPNAPPYKVADAKTWITPKVTLASGFQPKFKDLEKDVERFVKDCSPISRCEYEAYGMKAYDDALDMMFDVYWQNKVWPPLVKMVTRGYDHRWGHNRYVEKLSELLLDAKEFEHLTVIWTKILKQQSAYYRSRRRDQKKFPDDVHEDRIIAIRGWLTVTLSELMRICRMQNDDARLSEYQEMDQRLKDGKNP